MALTLHIDGGSRGNPGPAGAGVVIHADDATLIYEGAFFLGHQTNNAAEYYALIHGLQRIAELGESNVTVYSDSELLVRQITGQYRVKNPNLARLFEQVQMLLLRVPCWSIQHIPREENRRADELANLAIDRGENVIVFDAKPAAASAAPPTPPAAEAPASEEQAAPDGEPAPPPIEASGRRAVRVTVVKRPDETACPVAVGIDGDGVVVESALPPGLCIYAAHALLPTIIAILNTRGSEFDAIPTLTVQCTRPECGATFHVSPFRTGNGAATRPDDA